MTSTDDAVRVWGELLDSKQQRTTIKLATTGNGAGTVDVTDKPGWIWARFDEVQDKLSMVRCIYGLGDGVPVLVGKWHADDKYEQVLSVNWGRYSEQLQSADPAIYMVPRHGETHHGTHGNDPAYIDLNNITIGRVKATDPASLSVIVDRFMYAYGTEIRNFDTNSIDISASVPGIDGHRYVLVYFDLDTESLDSADGVIAPYAAPPDIPSLDGVNAIPLAVIELETGQTTIIDLYDIWQHKLLIGSIGGAVPPHTHTTDASGGASLIGIQELMLNCSTSLPVIGGQIWPVDVYHELYIQDTGLYVSQGILEADLTRINADLAWGCGQILVIRPADSGIYLDYRITVRHNADGGNIILYGERDVVLDDSHDHMLLIYDGTNWVDFAYHLSKFGDFKDGNYTEFEEDGTLVAYGDAEVWDDVQVSIGRVSLGASAPTWTAYRGSEILEFDKAQDNLVNFTLQTTHSGSLGEAIEFHIHMTVPDNNAGKIKWVLTVSLADLNDAFPAESTYTYVQQVAANSQDLHLLVDITDNIGSAGNVSSVALCSLMREGTDPVDDYNNSAYVVYMDAHTLRNTMGSREELSK